MIETDLKTDINVDTTSVVAPSSMGRSDCTALVATRATLELDLFFFCLPSSARKILSKIGSVAGALAAFFSALRYISLHGSFLQADIDSSSHCRISEAS